MHGREPAAIRDLLDGQRQAEAAFLRKPKLQ
jgi:hypothetical protein